MKPVKLVVIMFAAVSIGILITIGLLINLQHTAQARSIDSSKPSIIGSTPPITPVLYLVKDINPITGSKPVHFNAVSNIVFFQANDGSHGKELWRSDGTAAGTALVKDINPGITNSDVIANDNWATLNGIGIFDANDGTHGYELWRTDGTPSGTVMISDINPFGNSYPSLMTTLGNVVFFQATDGVHGDGLWRTDGTLTGTTMITGQINPSIGASTHFASLNGTLYFEAFDSVHGYEVWRSDGTLTHTYMITDINPGITYSNASAFTVFNNKLYFNADDGVHGSELWRTDGTPTGTLMITDINPSGNSNLYYLTPFNNALYFRATDGLTPTAHGSELWRTDGTPAGTQMISDINPSGNGSPGYLIVLNNALLFGATNDDINYGLWRSDGTPTNTRLITNIAPSLNQVVFDNQLYFPSYDSTDGQELWQSDGTPTGTVMISGINPGIANGLPSNEPLVSAANHLFFEANNGTLGFELWAVKVDVRVFLPVVLKNL